MKFSEILDKPLLSLSEGSVVGRVRGCLLNADKTRLEALDVGDGWLGAREVQVGESAVLVKSSAAVQRAYPDNVRESPLYLDMFRSDGSLVGQISDLAFDEKFALTHFVAGDREVPRSLMLSAGENAVVVCENEDALRKERRRIASAKRTKPAVSDVGKVSSTFTYLIGRKVTEDIFNQRGERIVRKNSVVSLHTLQVCREYGKLLLLAKYARTN